MITFRSIVFAFILYYIWSNEKWEGFGLFLVFLAMGIAANQFYKFITSNPNKP